MLKKIVLFILFMFTNSTFIKSQNNIIITKYKKANLLVSNHKDQLLDKIITPEFKQTTSKIIVKSLSDTLPQFDSISHIVLNTNSKLITYVLHNDFLPEQIKKDIILLTIKFTQEGDNIGGQILELYYNIVNHIL